MKFFKIPVILFFILNLFSCGEYFYRNDRTEFEKKYKFKDHRNFCSLNEENNALEIAGPSKEATSIMKRLILERKEFKNMTLVELNVAWALIQMNFRPDLASPTSSLQFIHVKNGAPHYFQFDLKQSDVPFLSGLNYILKKYKSSQSLKSIASLLFQHLPRSFPITDEFSAFLSQYDSQLVQYDQFRLAYYKAAQIIRKGESLPKLNFKKILSKNKLFTKSPRTHLFRHKLDKDTNLACNIDIGLYKKNVFLISNLTSPEGLSFGISRKNGDHIIMVSSNFFRTPEPYKDSYLISGKVMDNPMMICHLNNSLNGNQMTIVSSKGRDPGQHLYHLLNFEIQQSESVLETQEFINFPRHLFLRNPDRLVYESAKGSEDQLRNFLSLDFPIYHKGQLGRIWIHYFNSKTKKSSLLIDHRTESDLSCIK